MRKMTWALIAWSVIILVWVIGAGVSGANTAREECANDPYLSYEECVEWSDTGTAIGITFVLVFGFLGFMVLGMIWFMTKPKETTRES